MGWRFRVGGFGVGGVGDGERVGVGGVGPGVRVGGVGVGGVGDEGVRVRGIGVARGWSGGVGRESCRPCVK